MCCFASAETEALSVFVISAEATYSYVTDTENMLC